MYYVLLLVQLLLSLLLKGVCCHFDGRESVLIRLNYCSSTSCSSSLKNPCKPWSSLQVWVSVLFVSVLVSDAYLTQTSRVKAAF